MNTGMPGKGSSIFTPFTGVLPENKRETINAGISLFELICIGAPTGTQIFGFHDVDVKIRHKERDATFGLEYKVRWHRGIGNERNYINYEYDKKTERSYAFVPDDPVWHNRMLLAETINSGKYAISQFIMPGGIMSGDAITEELKFIAECIFDHSVIHKGKVLFRSKNLDEALRFADEETAKGRTCQPVHSKIEEIENIVRRYGITWKASPEFVNGIRADIEKKIKEKFSPEIVQQNHTVADPVETLKAILGGMSQQERLSVFQAAMSNQPTQQEETKLSVIATAPATEQKKPIVLENLGNQQLKDLAEDMGLFIKGMQRADIIAAIKEERAKREKPAEIIPTGTIAQQSEVIR